MARGFTWTTSGRARLGESRSGDGAWHRPLAGGARGWVCAVVDGLGHGEHAADATDAVLAALDDIDWGDDRAALERALRACHRGAASTRGAVVGLARVRPDATVDWTGVGNIDALTCRATDAGFEARHTMISRPGVVGYRLPELHTATVTLEPGDLLVMHSDGIEPGWVRRLGPTAPVELASRLVDHFALDADDACVTVGWLEPATTSAAVADEDVDEMTTAGRPDHG